MSDRPTPETDQIEKDDGFKIKESVTTCGDESSSVYINVIHARQLERERDKVREALENEMKFHHRTHAELVRTQCKLLDMQMGRDEIQGKYDNLATEHMLVVNKTCGERDDALALANQMSESNQILMADVKHYRDKNEKSSPSNNDVYLKAVLEAVTKMAVELKAERDEAKEALREIEQVFIDTDNTYEGLWKIGGIVRAALEETNE